MNSEWRFESASPEETLALGGKVARCLTGGEVLGLVGPLGAGKTLFVRGIANANADGDSEVVEAFDEDAEGGVEFATGETGADAHVDAVAEGDVGAGVGAADVETVWIVEDVLVAVR